jgi:hypothetical protein
VVTKWRALACKALALVLCAGIFGASLDLHHHAIDHDAACQIAVAAHDASAHRIGAQQSSSSPASDHCFFCHWARSFRLTSSPAKRVAGRQVERTFRPVHAAVRLAVAPDLSNLPARAPPQFS